MVSAGDFRNGLTIEIDGTVYQVIEFQHVKPGKGAAFVRTKLKNVVDGGGTWLYSGAGQYDYQLRRDEKLFR